MEIKIYVDFENREVLTESQYEEEIKRKSLDYSGENETLDDFLGEVKGFTLSEVFDLTKEDKSRIFEAFRKYCEELAEEDLEEEYEDFILEI